MKFRTKVVVYMIIMLAIIFGAGSSALIYNSFNGALQREKASVKQSYEMLVNTLKVVNSTKTWTDSSEISKVIKEMSKQKSTSWVGIRVRKKKKVTYQSGSEKNNIVDLSGDIDEKTCQMKIISTGKSKYFIQISGVLKVGKELNYLDILYDITSIYNERDRLVRIYFEIFVLLIIICGFLSYSNSFIMTRPLTKLARASKLIASGNMSSRSRVKTNDEIGQLSKEFDNMADHLEENINDMKDTMERQNQFIGNFTHELKTPMTSIIGYADLIRSQSLKEEEQIEAANYIYSEGKRLERLSLKLLDIFVTENTEIKLTADSPKRIVEQIVDSLKQDYYKRNIKLECQCEQGVCMMEPDLIRSLVVNLVDNCRKAIAEGGLILVKTKMTDQGCIIKIQDNGRVMPKEALNHITEAFYRVDKSRSRKQGGAGLGLALCSNIVKIHNGSINFQSKEGIGTIVTVELKGGRS
ncbi:MAG: HAMP domain-containing protein [Eubacterium sp.]|nr:HAMP domain-containing protein [Eubacterium sp.]